MITVTLKMMITLKSIIISLKIIIITLKIIMVTLKIVMVTLKIILIAITSLDWCLTFPSQPPVTQTSPPDSTASA